MKQYDEIKQDLIKFIEDLRSNKDLNNFDEAKTKQFIVQRLFNLLDWNIFDSNEVIPEYTPINGIKNEKLRVDYALKHNNELKAFIEVKKIGEDLKNHEEQLINYSYREGVDLAVLTNGTVWWFYLPLERGPWQERKFCSIDLLTGSLDFIANKFIGFLYKENVISGEAILRAKIELSLPKVWEEILKDPNEILIKLLAERTEQICGERPDFETVKDFIIRQRTEPGNKVRPPVGGEKPIKKVVSFIFEDKEYQVNSWRQLLFKICEILNSRNPKEFEEKVLTLKGKKRPWFSKDKNLLRSPSRINGTSIYVETDLGSNEIYNIICKLLDMYGYSKNSLKIKMQVISYVWI